MPSSPQMSQAVMAMEEEILRADECASFCKAAKIAVEPGKSIILQKEPRSEQVTDDEDDEDEVEDLQTELEAVLSQKEMLEEELQEAGGWATDMQGVWEKTESRWLSEMQALNQRMAAAEEQAHVLQQRSTQDDEAQDDAGSTNATQDVKIRCQEAEKRAQTAESMASEANKLLAQLIKQIEEVERERKEAEAMTESLDSKFEEFQASYNEVTQSVETCEEELQMATAWADETSAKYEAGILEKQEVLKALGNEIAVARAGQARCQLDVPGSQLRCVASEQDALKAKAISDTLLDQLATVEDTLACERAWTLAIAVKDKEMRQANAAAMTKHSEAVKEDSDRCVYLQKELENVNREIKSSKGCSKALVDKKGLEPKKIEELRKEEIASAKAQQTAEDVLETLVLQLSHLKAQISCIPESERMERMQHLQEARRAAKVQELKAREQAQTANRAELPLIAAAAMSVEETKKPHVDLASRACTANCKVEAPVSAVRAGAGKSAAKAAAGSLENDSISKVTPAVPRTKAAKAAAREAALDLAAGRSSHKGNRMGLANKQTLVWACGFIAIVQATLFVVKNLM